MHRLNMLVYIALLLLMALSTPVSANAASLLIGVVFTGDLSRYRNAHQVFLKSLAQKGYDSSNVEIILQTPNPDPISWANTIRKFKAIDADIIVTYGAPVTLVAIREGNDIPVSLLMFTDRLKPVYPGA